MEEKKDLLKEEITEEVKEEAPVVEEAPKADEVVEEVKDEDSVVKDESNQEEKAEIDLSSLIVNNDEAFEEEAPKALEEKAEEAGQVGKNKIFKPYKIKDIVFLAIMAACMLVTSAVMPLVIHVPVFGIIHMALGIQCSLFPVIGLMKVRKPGSLLIMSACFGVFLLFINFIMGIGVLLCALITEALVILIFRGYEKDGACVFASTIFFPISLPLLYVYYKFLFNGEAQEAVGAMINPEPGVAVGITFAIVAITFVGSIIGAIIARELKKAGVLKK